MSHINHIAEAIKVLGDWHDPNNWVAIQNGTTVIKVHQFIDTQLQFVAEIQEAVMSPLRATILN